MLRSLVGSEMCIRDSINAEYGTRVLLTMSLVRRGILLALQGPRRMLSATSSGISDSKIAVLIDAENTPARMAETLLAQVSKYGIPVIKRAYGDFSKPNMVNWKSAAISHAISTEQQFSYTAGKNSTDMRLTIDAMDILHSPVYQIDDFMIVSSDSDFAPLASRLRMAGKGRVYGAGHSKTASGFKNSVDKFIILSGEDGAHQKENLRRSPADHADLQKLLMDIVEDLANSPEENLRLSGVPEHVDAGANEEGAVYVRSLARVLGRRMVDFKPEQFSGFVSRKSGAGSGVRTRFIDILASMSEVFELTHLQKFDGNGRDSHWVISLRGDCSDPGSSVDSAHVAASSIQSIDQDHAPVMEGETESANRTD
eukprot:TRINITY_DN19814_c0_g1_i1.p1 TRINITY_DN19814_c0_g1~~TRINITY_DN19814_c0_g1_i1.p1  ORF type:complete len:369 (-),score=70.61 TRINITY_DN19814_c0_g1_i1:87-1193(-)